MATPLHLDPTVWGEALQPRMNRYFVEDPTARQRAFLLLDSVEEAFYGGAGGGGKSSALLMAALQYVDIPRYAALILRRTYADLSLPGALIDRAYEWLGGTDAKWNDQTHTWTFPWVSPPATITFGHLEHEKSHLRYKSSEFQYIAFDEVTEFEEKRYLFLRSRLRRRVESTVPLRIRSASNPGGPGHEWVKRRFLSEGPKKGRSFIPAKLKDNPYVDRASYERQLSHLPPVLRAQILDGNWDVSEGGKVISRSWFRQIIVDKPSTELRVRSWDLAASLEGKRTAGVLMSRAPKQVYPYEYVVENVVKGKWTPGERDNVIVQTARLDGKDVIILIEQEPGSGGVAQNYELTKKLRGYRVESVKVSGERSARLSFLHPKVRRAGPFASQAEIGNVALVRGSWVDEWLDELDNFPEGRYSDQVDATSLAFNWLSEKETWQIDDGLDNVCECGSRPHEPWCDDKNKEPDTFYDLLHHYGPNDPRD